MRGMTGAVALLVGAAACAGKAEDSGAGDRADCLEEPTPLGPDEAAPDGLTPAAMVAALPPAGPLGRVTWQAPELDAGREAAVEVGFAADVATARWVDARPNPAAAGGAAAECPSFVAVDAAVELRTDDGWLDEAGELRLEMRAADWGPTLRWRIPERALAGALPLREMTPDAPEDTEVQAWVDAMVWTDGVLGSVVARALPGDGPVQWSEVVVAGQLSP
jgi:hypothetical protein